jgi:glyoxylase-like metal-dependent hydrolase (beta-lactamase superfamily II)
MSLNSQLKTQNSKRLALTASLLAMCCMAIAQDRPEAKNEPLTPGWCKKLPRPGYKNLERVPTGQSWFEVYRIQPGVFALYEPHQYEEVIPYLIVGSKRALLFDTGLGIGDIRSVVGQLTKLPVTVLNSHTHFDHIGGNAQFNDIMGRDTAYTRTNAAGGTREQLAEVVLPERICGDLPPGFSRDNYAIEPFKITRFVKDGEMIDLGDRKLQVLFTPGHTPDSVSLLDRANGLLFTGDMFYAGPIFLYVPESDVAAYKRSVARYATLAPKLKLVLPAHNFPAEKPEMLVKLQHALREIDDGRAKFQVDQDRREYLFDGFSIVMTAPK